MFAKQVLQPLQNMAREIFRWLVMMLCRAGSRHLKSLTASEYLPATVST
jgi:hypothetical protein